MTHGIVEILKGNASIQALVGMNLAADTYKVYPVIIPQSEKPPYIAVRTQFVAPNPCKGEKTKQEHDTIQVDCYGNNYEETYLLYRTVREILDAETFTLSDGTVMDILFANGQDLTDRDLRTWGGELVKRDFHGIMSFYTSYTKLGAIT